MNRLSPSRSRPSDGPGSDAESTRPRIAPGHDALPPGTRLAEYEILAVLGRGASGIVYLCMDHGLQRQIAIKEFLPAALASRDGATAVAPRSDRHAQAFARGLEAFVDEARLLARIDHPALLRVYRFWQANGTAYMAMPHYEGTTLAAARQAMARPPDEAWMRELLLPLLGALDALHGASCYPRDISPDTIVLLPDGRPVLLDVGAARELRDARTQAHSVTLKPAFAPVEQYAESASLPRGPWSSLYSLAAVAYYCVSGHPPLASALRALDDPMEPLFQVVDRLGRSFPELDYSVAFVSAIERALSVRPRERPRSVAEFRFALLGNRAAAEAAGAPPAAEDAQAHGASPPPASSRDDAARCAGVAGVPDGGGVDEAPREPSRRAPPQAEPVPQTARKGRAGFIGAAAAALLVLGAGGWLMWSDYRAASPALPALSLRVEPAGRPAPPLPPEPPAENAAAAPSGAAAEPQVPPPEVATPEAPQGALAQVVATAADAPARSAPTDSAAEEKEAPSPEPPARVVVMEPDDPRVLCGPRTPFSLYRCMKTACDRSKYYDHPECKHLRMTDEVRALR